jgi:hypothetical protein
VFEKTEIMEQIIYRALVNSYHKRLAYLKSLKIITLNAYSKVHKLSHPNLINKAKRQTIPAFMERGVWMIGDEGDLSAHVPSMICQPFLVQRIMRHS